MSTVADLLARKGHDVACATPEQMVFDAVHTMNELKIGAVVVVDGDRRVVGMFTERDVLRRVVGEEREPRMTPVNEVMTSEVAYCRLDTQIEEARGVMAKYRIRHLPVCAVDGKLLGVISIGDLNAWDADDQGETIKWLNEYIAGRV
jgi:CBS domain-containing protein